MQVLLHAAALVAVVVASWLSIVEAPRLPLSLLLLAVWAVWDALYIFLNWRKGKTERQTTILTVLFVFVLSFLAFMTTPRV